MREDSRRNNGRDFQIRQLVNNALERMRSKGTENLTMEEATQAMVAIKYEILRDLPERIVEAWLAATPLNNKKAFVINLTVDAIKVTGGVGAVVGILKALGVI